MTARQRRGKVRKRLRLIWRRYVDKIAMAAALAPERELPDFARYTIPHDTAGC